MRRTLTTTLALIAATIATQAVWAGPLATETVQAGNGGSAYLAEGVVEAVRSSAIGAEQPGRITALLVKAGDRVKEGQTLVRIDERVAAQQALASQSQVAAAEAQLAAAQADFDRQKKLHEQRFLSKAALDRAESNYKSATAGARAQIAQATAASVQTGLFTLKAPYDGIVAETSVELGDMATPGKSLLTVYDPKAMRVSVNLPQSQLAGIAKKPVQVSIPGSKKPSLSIAPEHVVVLPTADPISQMVQVRISLPAELNDLKPGMFARAALPIDAQTAQGKPQGRITVAASAVITRSELTAVYVVGNDGKASLRQIRAGRRQGDRIEVLAGLDAGEKVALDPLAAARLH